MLWLFDLDNTLYPYSSGIFPHINYLINCFLVKNLKKSHEEVDTIRKKYVQIYGTTLLGMITHHDTNPEDYLREIHSFSIDQFLKKEPALIKFLENLKGTKHIFTNSPAFYAKKVLNCLGIENNFETIFSIESFSYHGKPDPFAFKNVIETLKTNEIIHFVDDEPENIETAKRFNFVTYWVDSRNDHFNNYYEDELFLKLRG